MKHISRVILLVFSLFVMSYGYAAEGNSPVGFWKTIDDKTGRPQAIIQITESSSHVLYGRIVKTFPKPGAEKADPNEICTACKGARHNQRIVGMQIVSGLKQVPDEPTKWTNGEIYDPSSGKSYHLNAEVVDNGMKLDVRGYIGFSLIGRTQTWLRVSGASSD